MTLEVLKALAVILEFCMNQDSCKKELPDGPVLLEDAM